MNRFPRLLFVFGFCLMIFSVKTLFAQREQAGVRFEVFGTRTAPNPTPSLFNGANIGGSLFTLNAGFQSQLDRDGTMLLNSQFVYRNAYGSFPIAKNPINGNVSYGAISGHALYYEGIYLQTLSDKFQLALAARAGLFSDLNNINLSHFRIEPLFFLDYFFDEKFTAGLGFVYNTSNFGRLISVPLLHIYWIPSSEVLVDGLLPTRLDVWYYPSKQWDLGLSLVLNGTQFQLGQAPSFSGIDYLPGRTDKSAANINQLFFANMTIGPNIRYNLFEKTYVSIEGGYTVIRRFGFDSSAPNSGLVVAGRADTDFIVSNFRAFDFGVNSWFLRFGVQIMY